MEEADEKSPLEKTCLSRTQAGASVGVLIDSGLGSGLGSFNAKMLGNRVCYFTDTCETLWTIISPATGLKTLLISGLGPGWCCY